MRVYVQLAAELVPTEDGQNDLGPRLETAGEVVTLCGDVGDHDRLTPFGRLPAHTGSVRDAQVFGGRSLKRPEGEQPVSGYREIEAYPVVMSHLVAQQGTYPLQRTAGVIVGGERPDPCKQTPLMIVSYHSPQIYCLGDQRQAGAPVIRINEHYRKLKASYLFVEIAGRVAAYESAHPDRPVIKLGIGDVTHALPPAAVEGFRKGITEQANDETFRGYGPEQGYEFLRDLIAKGDFAERGCEIAADEIFVSDGAKCDTGNFQELFSADITIAVPDPVYPVYVDTNVMAGRTGIWRDGRYDGLVYLPGTPENGFVPPPPSEPVDLVYLCFPNNPTGATATKEQLAEWVAYAHRVKAIILFDAAYEQFIRDDSLPHSIYEIDGAREVAVEFRSLSKTAGFTGTRCAYTVVPHEVKAFDSEGTAHAVRDLWNRRQSTKFNGVSYPVQTAAAAVFSPRGREEIRARSDYYLANATLIRETMEGLGYECTGGINSPYVWIRTGTDSWAFFDDVLNRAGVVITPGAGFGLHGEGYVRISAFNDREKVTEALSRIRAAL